MCVCFEQGSPGFNLTLRIRPVDHFEPRLSLFLLLKEPASLGIFDSRFPAQSEMSVEKARPGLAIVTEL